MHLRVKEFKCVLRDLTTLSSLQVSSLSDTFQCFVQRRKAEHHRKAEAGGASITSSLQAEIKEIYFNDAGTSGGSSNGCSSSLNLLRRHANCLALVLGWLETQQAAADMMISSTSRGEAVSSGASTSISRGNVGSTINALVSHHELVSLLKTIMSLVTSDLMLLKQLTDPRGSDRKQIFSYTGGNDGDNGDDCGRHQDSDLEPSLLAGGGNTTCNSDREGEGLQGEGGGGGGVWRQDELECSLQTVLVLLCILTRYHSATATASAGSACAWLQSALREAVAPPDLRSEVRALCVLLDTYSGHSRQVVPASDTSTGTSAGRAVRAPLLLSFAEYEQWQLFQNSTSSHTAKTTNSHANADYIFNLSSHEDLLVMRLIGRQQQLSAFYSSLPSVSRGGGVRHLHETGTVGQSSGRSHAMLPALTFCESSFPRYRGTYPSHSVSAVVDEEEWPVRRSFSGFLNSVLENLSAPQSESKSNYGESRPVEEYDPDSLYSLLLECQTFLLPELSPACSGGGAGRRVGRRGDGGGKSEEEEDTSGDEGLSSQILATARIASKVEGGSSSASLGQTAPPCLIPRAILLTLITYSTKRHDWQTKEKMHFPLQSGSLVLICNICCDLISVSYQSIRQVEYILTILTALDFTSAAVLSQIASWIFPKLSQIMDVVTESTPKYFISRCMQVLVAALPQESSSLLGNDSLRCKYAHQLIVKSCRDIHLHPSEPLAESVLLALQTFIAFCPIGVLIAQIQPLAEVISAVIRSNIHSIMETVGNLLILERDGLSSVLSLSRDEAKSFRLTMNSIRAMCLLCQRGPKQMKTIFNTLLQSVLQLYLVAASIPDIYKRTEKLMSGENGNPQPYSGMMRLVLKEKSRGEISSGKATNESLVCSCYCRWLWVNVSVGCQALRVISPGDWDCVTAALSSEYLDSEVTFTL